MNGDTTVDAVYTWVDPLDQEWLKQKSEYKHEEAVERLPPSSNSDESELYYSLLSLIKFAPWLRKVWIVCQRPQTPPFLSRLPLDIQVVFHDEIFPDASVLPSFNSYAIECCLHKVRGLAEHFIYFNDDMMLGSATSPSLFFDEQNGIRTPKVYIESEWNPKFEASILTKSSDIPYTASCKRIRRILNAKYGYDASRGRIIHEATALTKTCMREAEHTFPEEWSKCIRERFRHGDDIIPLPLALLNGVETGICSKGHPNPLYMWTTLSTNLEHNHRLFQRIARQKPALICINDVNPTYSKEVIYHYFGCLSALMS